MPQSTDDDATDLGDIIVNGFRKYVSDVSMSLFSPEPGTLVRAQFEPSLAGLTKWSALQSYGMSGSMCVSLNWSRQSFKTPSSPVMQPGGSSSAP